MFPVPEYVKKLSKPFFCPLQSITILKRKLFSSIFRRHKKGRHDSITSTASSIFSIGNVSHEPPPGPTPSPSPNDYHSKPAQNHRKKALLVGVEYGKTQGAPGMATSDRPLKGPHKDIRDMQQTLIEKRNYHPDEVTVLINTDDHEQVQPTKANIEKYCQEMVAGACEGDRFFFLFAGHATQKPTDGEEEEDGQDEYIWTSDDEIIQDNVLRTMLVDSLPVGASLVAVFDACNSATLLDLDHYRCNRVYVPWVNKGCRRTDSLHNSVVRRCAMVIPILVASMSADIQDNVQPPGRTFTPVTQSPVNLPAEIVAEVFDTERGGWCPGVPMHFCDSPVARFCNGRCRERWSNRPEAADVICLSAAKDCQRTWQNAEGSSLTQVLIKFLDRKPDATIKEVLIGVSHGLHSFYLDMHQKARQYKRDIRDVNRIRRIKGKQSFPRRIVEMDNFQDAQISSHKPLDMQRRWEM